jgi:hypothetical protein
MLHCGILGGTVIPAVFTFGGSCLMSDTKTSQPPRDNVGMAAKDTVNTAARSQRDAVGAASDASHRAVDDTRKVAEATADSATRAADTGSKVASEGREVMLMGMHAAADVNGRLADTAFDRGHRILSHATHAMDIYRDTGERTASHVQALFTSYLTMSRGIQRMQHAWLEMIDHAAERAAHKPQDLLRCRSLVELAEVQRDLYVDAVNHALDASNTLLELASKTTQEAVRPLQNHRNPGHGDD